VDGTLLLLPGGKVLRSLAVFQLSDGGASIISPAPAVLTAPSS
jgi:hypothetical protein